VAGPRFAVDGYNLVHKLPELKALVERDLELARDRLVSLLAGYAAGRRVAVTVVFDGRRGFAGTRGDSRSGVKVVFARSDADSYIKQMLERERSPKSWTVVTSDNSIRLHVADFGAKLLRSEEFARELTPGRPTADGSRLTAGLTQQEVKPEPGGDTDWADVKKATTRIECDTWTRSPKRRSTKPGRRR
jgi:predicted RNA-binding protein with PIN domain